MYKVDNTTVNLIPTLKKNNLSLKYTLDTNTISYTNVFQKPITVIYRRNEVTLVTGQSITLDAVANNQLKFEILITSKEK